MRRAAGGDELAAPNAPAERESPVVPVLAELGA
jgi:hypothetical protein